MDDNIYGALFPIEIEPSTGHIKEVNNEDVIQQSIFMIIQTMPQERFLYPDFGCPLQSYVFGLMDYTTLKEIELTVKNNIEKWEKRISNLQVTALLDDKNEGQINISVKYMINGLNKAFNYIKTIKIR